MSKIEENNKMELETPLEENLDSEEECTFKQKVFRIIKKLISTIYHKIKYIPALLVLGYVLVNYTSLPNRIMDIKYCKTFKEYWDSAEEVYTRLIKKRADGKTGFQLIENLIKTYKSNQKIDKMLSNRKLIRSYQEEA